MISANISKSYPVHVSGFKDVADPAHRAMAASGICDEESQGMAQMPLLSMVQAGRGSWSGCRSARVCECVCTRASPGTWERVGVLAYHPYPYDLHVASGKGKPSCCPTAGVDVILQFSF